jgi:acyl-CoA synthetase (AMP-forming)/AMP-acid ligase II
MRITRDDGRECPVGEIGEVVIRCAAVSPGYWHKPEITAERFRQGALHTGDMAYRDENGYIYLVDRKNDLIISGAFNIYPGEIERVIATHPGVQSVAVFGVRSTEWGESPHAAIIPATRWGGDVAGLERELGALCRNELAGYKQPRGFSFHDEFPVSGAGKVLKSELRLLVAP